MPSSYREIIDRLNEERKNQGGKRYLEAMVPYKKLKMKSSITRKKIGKFIDDNGLEGVSVIKMKTSIKICLDPDDHPKTISRLKRVCSKYDVPIKEFYGLVQLDGDEPDASRNYDRIDNNGLTTMEDKRAERRKRKAEQDEDERRKEEKKNNPVKKRDVMEVTAVSNIPSPTADTFDILSTPIQRNRKKVAQK